MSTFGMDQCDHGTRDDRCTSVVDPDDYAEVWTQRQALDRADLLGWQIGDESELIDLRPEHREVER